MHMLEANRDDSFTKNETLALGHLLLMYWPPKTSSTAWIPQYTGLKALSPWEMFVENYWTTHRSRVRHSKGRSCWEGSSKDIKNLTYIVGSNVDEDDEVDQGFEILVKWKFLSLSVYSRMPNQIRATKSPMKTLWNLVNSCTAAAGQPLRTLNHLPRNNTQLIRRALSHQSILGGLQIANCKPPQSFGTVGIRALS